MNKANPFKASNQPTSQAFKACNQPAKPTKEGGAGCGSNGVLRAMQYLVE